MPTSIKTICEFKDATISQDSDSTLPIWAEGPSDLGHEENELCGLLINLQCNIEVLHSGPTSNPCKR